MDQKNTLNTHRDSEGVRGHDAASGSSNGAGNDAGGENMGGTGRGQGVVGGIRPVSRSRSPDRSRWKKLPRYDTGQGEKQKGAGGGRKFVAKELEYGFIEFRETSLPPPMTGSSTLLQNFAPSRTSPPPPRPTGKCRRTRGTPYVVETLDRPLNTHIPSSLTHPDF